MVHRSGRARRRTPLLFALILVAAWSAVVTPAAFAAGAVSLTGFGTAATQDFDTLVSTPDNGLSSAGIPTGWELVESGTNANTTYRVGTGSNTTGDTYSFGAAAASDRAFGMLRSGSLVPMVGAQLSNDTGGTITSLAIAYTGEQWRLGQNPPGRAPDRLDLQLSTDATSLTTGAWTDHDALDFASPVVSGTVGALDGNAAPNRTAVSSTITGLSIPAGATFWIRWADTDLIPGADDGLAIDGISITPAGTIATGPSLRIDDVSQAEGDTGTTTFTFTVSLSEPAGAGGVSYDIATADGSAASPGDFTATSLTGQVIPDGSSSATFEVQVNGDAAFEPDEAFSVSVTNVSGATVIDGTGAGTITNDDANACESEFTPVYQIQGSGPSAAITGTITTQGVVVGDFEGTAAASGFYLQDLTGDGNAATSDGIFVFTGSTNLVNAGDVVRVTGYARERFNQTTLNGSNSNSAAVPAANIVTCGTDSVAATDVNLPLLDSGYPERFEGMLVRFPQDLVISEYFNYDRFGEIVLALPLVGEPRPFSGTAIDAPGTAAIARMAANNLRRITLDDVQSAQNPPVLRHPNGNPFTLANRFRGGDRVENAIGVLGFDFSLYRIFPTGPADYTAVNARPAAPEPVGGTVRVAAMNTLNYFLTLDTTASDSGPGPCGGNASLDCRGADADQPDEFSRQRTKLLQALAGLDADIIGLNELENTPGVEPLADLAAGLPGYAYVNTGTIGTDAIKVGLLYRPAAVSPVGAYQVLDSTVDPRFIDTKSRPALAQTFEVNATGARFTVAVNHLKSKGSDCVDVGDPDLGDGQGNCSQTRRAAAEALVDWLATDPTGSGDPDILIMGDLNSYAREDTITEIRTGADDVPGTGDDFTNLIAHFQGQFAYSYTFDGQAGYLDHALANASLLGQVTGTAEWHINSDEPDILDYDTTFKPPAQEALYEPNAYRTSDHDPVVVGLVPNATPTVDAGGPYAVDEGGSVALAATGSDPNAGDELAYAWDLDDDGSFETAGRTPDFSAAGLDGPTTATVHVRVTDAGGLTATDDATIEVANADPVVDDPVTAPEPSAEGEGSVASASFSDPGTGETFTCTVDYGDGSGALAGTVVGTTCTGPSHAYAAYGTYPVTVAVTDDDGGVGSATADHVVVFAFTGFLAPVDNGVRNRMKAGAAVPLKFSLGGNHGLNVLAAGSPTSRTVTCDSSEPVDPVEETAAAGASGLVYDPATDVYTYVWKTQKGWAGTCRELTLTLVDGTAHTALFQFTN